jgi:hypothetical protein
VSQTILSGIIDQYVYFTAVPGLTGLTVAVAKDATSFTNMTTPTITEMGSDGDYALLMDEQTTIGTGNVFENVRVKVLSGTTVVSRFEFVLADPSAQDTNVVSINGTTVLGAGTSGDLWRG